MPLMAADDWSRLDPVKFLAYGGAFTIAVDAALYPLELLKTRVQVEAKASGCGGVGVCGRVGVFGAGAAGGSRVGEREGRGRGV